MLTPIVSTNFTISGYSGLSEFSSDNPKKDFTNRRVIIRILQVILLMPSAHKSARIDKISILKLERTIKQFPMSVATMSR